MLKRIGTGMSGGIGSRSSDKAIDAEKNNELAQLLSSYGLDKEPLNKHDELVYLPIDSLAPGSTQPRQHFKDESLENLAESIRSSNGVIEPLIVAKMRDGSYEIIAGERRWRAANILDLDELPCIVKTNLGQQTKLILSLVENIQREDLLPLDEARGLEKLVNEFNLSHQKVAEIVGRSRSAVSNLLRLLELPLICKEALNNGDIEMGHARALLPLPDDAQVTVLNECIRKRLTVRAVERRVAFLLSDDSGKGGSEATRMLDDEILEIERAFFQSYSSPVYIKVLKNGEAIVKLKSIEVLKKMLKQ